MYSYAAGSAGSCSSAEPLKKNVKNIRKALDRLFFSVIVHAMNQIANRNSTDPVADVPKYQLEQFQELILKLFQCCQERMQYQCERFGLPDAEFRCLMLFGEERYLTAKGIALKMNVVKSRVSKIIEGLLKKKLIQRIKDPEDSRVSLLSLTSIGHEKLNHINEFLNNVHNQVLLQIAPDQRKTVLTNLDILKASMEAVKEMMV
jgi:DNA-binding MarR family transcriptional regulator